MFFYLHCGVSSELQSRACHDAVLPCDGLQRVTML